MAKSLRAYQAVKQQEQDRAYVITMRGIVERVSSKLVRILEFAKDVRANDVEAWDHVISLVQEERHETDMFLSGFISGIENESVRPKLDEIFNRTAQEVLAVLSEAQRKGS